MFYDSETVVKLNSFNLYFYFFIDSIFIFATSIYIYITLELPLKNIFRYFFKSEERIKINEILGRKKLVISALKTPIMKTFAQDNATAEEGEDDD